MKTKIALAVAVVALFVAVPSATPKGHAPASVGATIGCSENDGDAGGLDSDTDTCIISFTGMNAGTTYNITISDTCSGDIMVNSRSGSTNYTFTFVSVNDCGTGLAISVTSGSGRRTAAVPVTVTGDTGTV
jgi:hypothetical protein